MWNYHVIIHGLTRILYTRLHLNETQWWIYVYLNIPYETVTDLVNQFTNYYTLNETLKVLHDCKALVLLVIQQQRLITGICRDGPCSASVIKTWRLLLFVQYTSLYIVMKLFFLWNKNWHTVIWIKICILITNNHVFTWRENMLLTVYCFWSYGLSWINEDRNALCFYIYLHNR